MLKNDNMWSLICLTVHLTNGEAPESKVMSKISSSSFREVILDVKILPMPNKQRKNKRICFLVKIPPALLSSSIYLDQGRMNIGQQILEDS